MKIEQLQTKSMKNNNWKKKWNSLEKMKENFQFFALVASNAMKVRIDVLTKMLLWKFFTFTRWKTFRFIALKRFDFSNP